MTNNDDSPRHGGHGHRMEREWPRGFGRFGGIGENFGFPPPWARGGMGRRMRRGDVRIAILRALEAGPTHGYEIIGRLEQASGGSWRPSAGSVYPTLQMLEEEGLVTGRDDGGKRTYELTDAGRTELENTPDLGLGSGGFPFGNSDEMGSRVELRKAVASFVMAIRQIFVAGDEEMTAKAVAILKDARQKLYQLLADE